MKGIRFPLLLKVNEFVRRQTAKHTYRSISLRSLLLGEARRFTFDWTRKANPESFFRNVRVRRKMNASNNEGERERERQTMQIEAGVPSPFALYCSTPDSIYAKADLYHSAAAAALGSIRH